MGVVNVTPDSFSDGGLYLDAGGGDRAWARSWSRDGAEILDVGGESTRPGAEEVGAAEELRRVEPVVAGAGRTRRTVSVDTSKARGRRGGARRRGVDRQRRHRAARRSRDGGALRRARGGGGADAHAGRTRGRCRTTRATTTSSTRSRRSSPSGSSAAVGAGIAEERIWLDPGDRLRQDARAQPGAAAPAGRAARAGPAAGGRHLAQELHRQGRRLRRGASGSAARSPPRCSPPPRAPTCCASTTSPRWRRRSRSPTAILG